MGVQAAQKSKVFVRWNVLNGELLGPRLAHGRRNDHKSLFGIEELPERSVYLADIGFFAIERFHRIARDKKEKRYFVSRLQSKTNLYTRRGHRIELRGILPQEVNQVRARGSCSRARRTACPCA